MQAQSLFRIDESSQVGTARRAAIELARVQQLDEELTGKAGLAATECATNILKHAGHGRILIRPLRCEDIGGIEIIALDKGPGIADVGASLRDGHSTRGTLGGGLGALSRMSERFEVFTQAGKGTAIRVELWARPLPPRPPAIEFGGVCVALEGEPVSGDDWAVHLFRDQITVVVADGLGHGVSAHDASLAATMVLDTRPNDEPQAIIEHAHAALARTRGAAVAVAKLIASAERGSFAGVGNIAARIEGTPGGRHLVSYNGTVGHIMRKVQEFAFPWPKDALLVLHSDGLTTHWSLSAYPGLITRHPALIAAVLYRDYDRGRDDVSVVVIRNRGSVAEAS